MHQVQQDKTIKKIRLLPVQLPLKYFLFYIKNGEKWNKFTNFYRILAAYSQRCPGQCQHVDTVCWCVCQSLFLFISQAAVNYSCISLYISVLGGAMRLPCKPDSPDKTHYLTDFYIQKFGLPLSPFKNTDSNTLLKFYNNPVITLKRELLHLMLSVHY